MSETSSSRTSDSLFRIWAPILIPVVGIAVAWGTMSTQLGVVQKTTQDLVKEVRTLSEGRIRTLAEQRNLEIRVTDAIVSRETIREMSLLLGTLEAKAEDNTGYINQIWPRLRALDKNITILGRAIERLHPNLESIILEEPQKF